MAFLAARPVPFLTVALLVTLAGVGAPGSASAFVGSPVGGGAGTVTLYSHADFERGKIEPNNNEDSWQDARWYVYTAGGSYALGDRGPLKAAYVDLSASFYNSPAERNERGAVDPTRCAGRVLADNRCEFHREDNGSILSLAAGFDFVHRPELAIGVFLRGMLPIHVNMDKFANPRIDYFGGGFTLGARFTSWLSYQATLYAGTGLLGPQNATVALTQSFNGQVPVAAIGPNASLGLRLGPYFDGDLTERFDPRYDVAYTPGYPEHRDRIRMMRFGMIMAPYIAFSRHLAIEGMYLQKIFGYDAPATRIFRVGLRIAF